MSETMTENDAQLEPWTETEVPVATAKGTTKMRGLVHPRVPGLAVTMLNFGTFDVTHTLSGKTVARGYERMGSACEAAAALACCADWRQDAAAITAEIEAHGHEPANIPKWTTTTKDGTQATTKRSAFQIVRGWHDEFPWELPEDDPMERAATILFALPRAAGGAA